MRVWSLRTSTRFKPPILFGRKVVIFSACKLPSNKLLDHRKLLRYAKATLDRYVANDYILVYFHHGLKSHNKPPFSFVIDVYHELGRSPSEGEKNDCSDTTYVNRCIQNLTEVYRRYDTCLQMLTDGRSVLGDEGVNNYKKKTSL